MKLYTAGEFGKYKEVEKAYSMAEYTIVDGYEHLIYSMKNTDA